MVFISKLLKNTIFLLIAAGLAVSCTKKNDAAGISQFTGTWAGSTCSNPASGTITIKSGTNDYSVYVSQWVGIPATGTVDSCSREVDVLGTVSGNTNSDIFTMAAQTFTDNCGRTYTISGGASKVNDTLYINFVTASSAGTTTCNFKGHK